MGCHSLAAPQGTDPAHCVSVRCYLLEPVCLLSVSWLLCFNVGGDTMALQGMWEAACAWETKSLENCAGGSSSSQQSRKSSALGAGVEIDLWGFFFNLLVGKPLIRAN